MNVVRNENVHTFLSDPARGKDDLGIDLPAMKEGKSNGGIIC